MANTFVASHLLATDYGCVPLLYPPRLSTPLTRVPSYVALTAVLSALVNQWHSIHVGGFRRIAKVPYPNAYAPQAEAEKEIEKYQVRCSEDKTRDRPEHGYATFRNS